MADGDLLGTVEVEVKANLDKLRADFARGKLQAERFGRDMTAATGRGVLNLTRDMQAANTQTGKFADNMVTVNRWIQEVDANNQRSAARWQTTSKVIDNNAAALRSMERATNPAIASQRLVATALRDVENQYRSGAITIAALNKAQQMAAPYIQNTAAQYEQLMRKFDPLRASQQKYAADLALINNAERTGAATAAQAARMRTTAAAAMDAVTASAVKGEASLTGWATSAEHHLRAMRLLMTFVGVDLFGRLTGFALKTLESTAALKSQAEQLGVTTGQLQEYRAIATQVGMSASDMDSAFETLGGHIDNIALGKVDPATKLFKKLGVSITDASGEIKSRDVVFKQLVDRLGQVGNEAERRGAQVIAFGSAGAKMGQLVAQGSAGIDRLRQAVRDTGMVLSDEQIQKADVTAQKLAQVSQVLQVKFASVVVQNADAIGKLADALLGFASVGLERVVSEIGALIHRFAELLAQLNALRAGIADFERNYSIPALINGPQVKPVATGLNEVGRSVSIKLPEARPADAPGAKPKGSNISLAGLLSPKGPKGPKGPKEKFDQFESDMAREKQQQLQLERDATGSLFEQNRIDREIIDLKLTEQIEQIKRQLHSKSLTANEAKQLTAAAQATAAMEKEAADRKLRVATIEQAAQYADELAGLEQDGLNIARAMARTDQERRNIDLAILDSKQQQIVQEKQKEIALAEEAHDEQRVAELTAELAKVRSNQLSEIKQFNEEHLTTFAKFRHDLPTGEAAIREKIDQIKFDTFNQKLQQAAQFAGDLGDAFGQAAGELAQLHNPLDVLKNLLTNLAETFTKNVIVKPVSDWATQHLGVPMAKQAFGKDLMKEGGLNAQQFDVALAQATGTLGGLQAALPATTGNVTALGTALTPATASLTGLTSAATSAAAALTAAGAAAGAGGAADSAGGILSMITGAAGSIGGAGVGGDIIGSGIYGELGPLGLPGFATGGFTGGGGGKEVKGLVHANEFVLNSSAVSKVGLPALSAMNSGLDPFVSSGAGSSAPGAPVGAGGDLGAAAQMLMQAATMLMDVAQTAGAGAKGGGGGGIMGMIGGLLPMAMGMFGGGLLGKGGGLGGMLGGLFGGGGGAAGAVGGAASSGIFGDLGALGLPGFQTGGFTGSGPDDEIAGLVHRNEFVFDAPTTRAVKPLLTMVSSGDLPSFMGGGLGGMKDKKSERPLHVHLGGVHVHGARDDRSARRSGRQALGEIQRGLAQVVRTGVGKK